MTNYTRDIGNIRLAQGEWKSDLGNIFAEAAKLMSHIVGGQLVHFKYDELYLFVDEACEHFRVGIPMIGNLRDSKLHSHDLSAGKISGFEIALEELQTLKLIKNLYEKYELSSDYFLRISANQGEYQVFFEKYLIQ